MAAGLQQLIEAALTFHPDDPGMLSNLGLVRQAQGDANGAIQAFQASRVFLKPQNSAAWFNTANPSSSTGRFDEAIEAYQQTLFVDPNHAEASNNLGVVLLSKGDIENAAERYRRALAAKPDYAHGVEQLGNVLVAQGKLGEAIEACRRAIALDPMAAGAYNDRRDGVQVAGRNPGSGTELSPVDRNQPERQVTPQQSRGADVRRRQVPGSDRHRTGSCPRLPEVRRRLEQPLRVPPNRKTD
jgi:tetratricopeptide (TPR) repeat protein